MAAILIPAAVWFRRFQREFSHRYSGEGLGELVMAIDGYAADHADRLPPTRDLAAFQAALAPYANRETMFTSYFDPSIRYLPNPNLSGITRSSVRTPTVLLYEGKEGPGGYRWVAFLPKESVRPTIADRDFIGLVQVKSEDWGRLRREQHLP